MFSKTKTKFKSILSTLLSAAIFVSGFSLAAGVTIDSAVDTNAATSTSEYESSVFSWDNATVYFLLTDRFNNGNTSNDHSYNRGLDKNGNAVSTSGPYGSALFMGGDFKGITDKINEGYFNDLGVNAIWLSAPYEQIHGYVLGGDGSTTFAHYSYHGYYVLDYTETDANFGTKEEFRELVDTAHEHGIRIVLDIVMNHSGYQSIYDMAEYGFGSINSGWEDYYYSYANGISSSDYHSKYINYTSNTASAWAKWWGPDWIRCGLPGYTEGSGDIEGCLSSLPDFKTNPNLGSVGLPEILKTKWTKEGTYSQKVAKYGTSNTVVGYISDWLAEWVREYGVDGFRCDTAKHVEKSAWKMLKDKCVKALKEWKAENPSKALDDLDFWMTGECFGHTVSYSDYYTSGGFDSMINFELAPAAGSSNIPSAGNVESYYSRYANSINNNDNFNVLTYIASHDTTLAQGDRKYAGSVLLMMPGGIQIYYGDETNRPMLNVPSDSTSGAGHMYRSFMNWNSIDKGVLEHWQKVGQFRNNHIAVGAGKHNMISAYNSSTGYTFSRTYDKNGIQDAIVATLFASANTDITIDVSSVWSDGTLLHNFYDDTTAVVSNGKVTFNSGANGTILIEEPVGAKYKVIVNHILQSTGEVLKTEVKKGELGESYTITPDSELLENYYVAKTVGSTTGKFTEEDKTVSFYYAFDASKKGTLTIKYIDKDTGAEIADSKTLIGDIGASYSVSPITIKDYEIVAEALPSNATGSYKKGNIDITFKYQYVEPETIKVHYYTTSWSNVNCYAYTEGTTVNEYLGKWPGKSMTSEGNGWYTIEIDAEEALVIFNNGIAQDPTGATSAKGYEAVGECYIKDGSVSSSGKVVVLYTDTEGNLIEKVTLKGMAGSNYTTEKKSFDGYTFSKVSGETSGTFTDGTITVTYVYAPDNSPARDKTVLKEKISEAKTYLNGEYTSASLTKLQSAITAAQKVYNSSTATQAEVNAQVKDLDNAINALVSTRPIDKSVLNTTILVAEVYASGSFTSDSLNTLNNVIKSAKTVYSSSSATQTQIDNKVKELQSAIDGLVEEVGTYIYVTLSGATITPYIYSWEGTNTALTGAWPGTQMTKCSDGTYKIQVPATGSYNFIVNNGGQNKTADITGVSGSQWVTITNDNLTSSSSYTIKSSGSTTVDKTALSSKITEAQNAAAQGSNYTSESLAALQSAINNAKAVYNNSSATQLQVDVQIAYLKGAVAGLKEVEEEVVAITNFTASSTSLTLGSSTTLSTTATGSNLQYKYAYTTGSGWTVIKAYSSTKSYTWTPTAAGTYTVRAFVTDGKDTVKEDITVTVKKAASSLSINTFKASNTSLTLGSSTTLSTTATGSNLQYKYAYTTGSGWTVIKAYSSTKSYTWTPTAVGTYTVRAFVTDGTTTAKKDITVKVTKAASSLKVTELKSFSTNDTANVGDTVKFGVTATGTTSATQYKFEYTRTGTTYATIQDYSTSRYPTWTPKNAGTYTIKVTAKTGTTTATKTMTFTVNEKITLKITELKSFSTNDTASIGDTVKFGVTATGTTSATQYKFEYTRTGTTYATIQDYSTSRYPTWTPKNAGTYTIKVTAKTGSTTATKTMTFTVKDKATTSITSFTSSKTSMYVLDSTTLTVKASGTGLKYKFAYQYNGSWTVIKDYSTATTCTFTPDKTGTYTIRVFVDDGSNVVKKDITITVK